MSELSIPSTPPLRERLPGYAAQLDKLEARYTRWQAQKEKDTRVRLKRELGLIGILCTQTGRIESERTIVCHEGPGYGVRTEHLAWDLGSEDVAEPADTYVPHLYLARSNHHFYKGDQGLALPHTPVVSFDLLRRVRNVRQQLER